MSEKKMSDNFCARKDKKLMQYRYEQVAEILAAKIRNGEWQIGQKLPGEIELAREYGVGRSTVRETLNILQQKGMIEKRHGSGTYVTENKKVMENPLLLLTSVGTMIKDAGYQAGSVFRSTTHELPTGHIQRKMGLAGDEKIVVVNRARTADGQPVAFSYNVFPQKLVGDIFDGGLALCACLRTIDTFRLFEKVNILTGGGPANSTSTITQFMYTYGIKTFKFGFASACAIVMTILVLLLSGFYIRKAMR